MAIKVYKKNTAGRRGMSIVKPENLTDKKPEKSLLSMLNRKFGRSNGKISVRHKGGGVKRRYRIVDFKMDKSGITGTVKAIEKDPNRNALIALVVYSDGDKRYVLATSEMKKGSQVITDKKTSIEEGNRMELQNIPVGTVVSNVELIPGKGGQIARSAGTGLIVQAIDGGMAHLKMPSSEIRMVRKECFATIGQVSNFEYSSMRIGKAGRKRHMGWRPAVRGSAMNPVDHPHGGGEGCQPIGLKHPKTPWGKPALGVKTRNKKKYSSRLILKRRKTRTTK
ncbi:MAG: 50S ribosomal protein L2 [Patescibacteria group bacterium]|jgi:large subunit ribosomal protein L2|nr:50S ribosomal protein L2 [Patescibacteria group bacterium]